MTSIQRQDALSTVLGQVARHLEWARAGADAVAMSALSHPLVSWLSRQLRNRKPSDVTRRLLAELGWTYRPATGSALETFTVALLQHLSGEYTTHVDLAQVHLPDYAAEWGRLTRSLDQPARLKFTEKLARILYPPASLRPRWKTLASRRARILHCVREFYPDALFTTVFIIKNTTSFSIAKDKINLASSMSNIHPGDGRLLLFYKEDGVLAALAPRLKIHPEEEDYWNSLLDDARTFSLFHSAFRCLLFEAEHGDAADAQPDEGGLALLNRNKAILEAIERATTIKELLNIFSVEPSTTALLTKDLFILEEIVRLEEQRRGHDRDQLRRAVLPELKHELMTAVNDTVQLHLLSQRQEAAETTRNFRAQASEMEEELQKIKGLIHEQEKRLADALIDEKEKVQSKLKELKENHDWRCFLAALRTAIPKTTVGSLKELARGQSLLEMYNRLVLHFDFIELDTDHLRTVLQRNSNEHRAELRSALDELSVTNFHVDGDVLEVSGRHVRLSECMQKWISKPEDLASIRQIQFLGSISVWLDADVPSLVGHGRNIVVVGQSVFASRGVLIDSSGANGPEHQVRKPSKPESHSTHGANGRDGACGESAGHVHILSEQPIPNVEKLSIRCMGGTGARGQDGGDGSDGKHGRPGKDGVIPETPPSSGRLFMARGEPGEAGRDGGKGGRPGRGGAGGCGGSIFIKSGGSTFEVSPKAKLASIPNFKSAHGKPGLDGEPGFGGVGGVGSRRGIDNAWARISVWPLHAFNPWKKYSGHLQAVKYSGFLRDGFRITELEPEPPALNGQRGERQTIEVSQERSEHHAKAAREVGGAPFLRYSQLATDHGVVVSSSLQMDEAVSHMSNEEEDSLVPSSEHRRLKNTLTASMEHKSRLEAQTAQQQQREQAAKLKEESFRQQIHNVHAMQREMKERMEKQLSSTQTEAEKAKVTNPGAGNRTRSLQAAPQTSRRPLESPNASALCCGDADPTLRELCMSMLPLAGDDIEQRDTIEAFLQSFLVQLPDNMATYANILSKVFAGAGVGVAKPAVLLPAITACAQSALACSVDLDAMYNRITDTFEMVEAPESTDDTTAATPRHEFGSVNDITTRFAGISLLLLKQEWSREQLAAMEEQVNELHRRETNFRPFAAQLRHILYLHLRATYGRECGLLRLSSNTAGNLEGVELAVEAGDDEDPAAPFLPVIDSVLNAVSSIHSQCHGQSSKLRVVDCLDLLVVELEKLSSFKPDEDTESLVRLVMRKATTLDKKSILSNMKTKSGEDLQDNMWTYETLLQVFDYNLQDLDKLRDAAVVARPASPVAEMEELIMAKYRNEHEAERRREIQALYEKARGDPRKAPADASPDLLFNLLNSPHCVLPLRERVATLEGYHHQLRTSREKAVDWLAGLRRRILFCKWELLPASNKTILTDGIRRLAEIKASPPKQFLSGTGGSSDLSDDFFRKFAGDIHKICMNLHFGELDLDSLQEAEIHIQQLVMTTSSDSESKIDFERRWRADLTRALGAAWKNVGRAFHAEFRSRHDAKACDYGVKKITAIIDEFVPQADNIANPHATAQYLQLKLLKLKWYFIRTGNCSHLQSLADEVSSLMVVDPLQLLQGVNAMLNRQVRRIREQNESELRDLLAQAYPSEKVTMATFDPHDCFLILDKLQQQPPPPSDDADTGTEILLALRKTVLDQFDMSDMDRELSPGANEAESRGEGSPGGLTCQAVMSLRSKFNKMKNQSGRPGAAAGWSEPRLGLALQVCTALKHSAADAEPDLGDLVGLLNSMMGTEALREEDIANLEGRTAVRLATLLDHRDTGLNGHVKYLRALRTGLLGPGPTEARSAALGNSKELTRREEAAFVSAVQSLLTTLVLNTDAQRKYFFDLCNCSETLLLVGTAYLLESKVGHLQEGMVGRLMDLLTQRLLQAFEGDIASSDAHAVRDLRDGLDLSIRRAQTHGVAAGHKVSLAALGILRSVLAGAKAKDRMDVPDLWRTANDIMDEANRAIGPVLRRYFQPSTTSYSRQLLRRALELNLGSPALEKLMEDGDSLEDSLRGTFLATTETAGLLLQGTELSYWNGACEFPGGKDLPLATLREGQPRRWADILLHHWQTAACANSLVHTEQEERERLEASLTAWQAAYKLRPDDRCGEITGEHDDGGPAWTRILLQMLRRLKLVPITVRELASVLDSARHVELTDLERILCTKFPWNWHEALVYLRVSQSISRRSQNNNENRTAVQGMDHEVLDTLRQALRKCANDAGHWKSELYDAVAAGVTDHHHMDSHAVRGIFQEMCDGGSLNADVLQELLRTEFRLWKEVLRKFHYNQFGVDRALTPLLIALETRFGRQVDRCARALVRADASHQLILDISEQVKLLSGLSDGRWVLNADVLSILETAGPVQFDELEEQLDTYMRERGDLSGEELKQSFANLELNSQLPEDSPGAASWQMVFVELAKIKSYETSEVLQAAASEPIPDWSEQRIGDWADVIKEERELRDPNIDLAVKYKIEILAVVCRAMQLFSASVGRGEEGRGYRPRDTQLASVLLFLAAGEVPTSRFAEIATGEGKTDISAMLAVHLALAGRNVAVITSSPILAANSSKELTRFFALFRIAVSNNCDDACRRAGGGSKEELASRYKAAVVYGDVGSFQNDVLHEEFMGEQVKGGWCPDFLIVDEVDSMLLDKGSNVLYISHSIPELKHLRPIFIDIWRAVNQPGAQQRKQALIAQCAAALERGKYKYPVVLKDFVRARLHTWFNKAFEAKAMELNELYVISNTDGRPVTIVDQDTGVDQANMQYSGGLHQFLQLKYGNKLSSESLKAIFISNLSYFSRFPGRLFGITGTLGSASSLAFLRSSYGVDVFKMPRHRDRNCTKEPGVVVPSFEELLDAIGRSVQAHGATQPVLVICETVKIAAAVHQHISQECSERSGDGAGRTIAYLSSRDDDEFQEQVQTAPLRAGDVIVSTNLAGRGTDLLIDRSCTAGLHVILSYIPLNRRVAKQAFGRTARAGKRGSTQYIVMEFKDLEPHQQSVEEFMRLMDAEEDARLESLETRELPSAQEEQKLLTKFVKLENKLVKTYMESKKFVWLKSELVDTYMARKKFVWLKSELDTYMARKEKEMVKAMRLVLRNQWAVWLDEVQGLLRTSATRDRVWPKFYEFKAGLLARAASTEQLPRFPSEYVKLARVHEEAGRIEEAIQLLERVVEEEPHCSEVAHYYLGICLMKRDADAETRKTIRFHLNTAKRLIEEGISGLMEMSSDVQFAYATMKNSSDSGDGNGEEGELPFCEQTRNEIAIYYKHLHALTGILGSPASDASCFLSLKAVNQDEAEASAIHEALLATNWDTKILRAPRFSKKVEVKGLEAQEGRGPGVPVSASALEVFYAGKEVKMADYFPEEMACAIVKTVQRLTMDRAQPKGRRPRIGRAQPKGRRPREVHAEDFAKCVLTKADLWRMLVDAGFLEQTSEVDVTIVHYHGETYEAAMSGVPKHRKIAIGKILDACNLQEFSDTTFASLDPETATGLDSIKERLREARILCSQVEHRGRITESHFAPLRVNGHGRLEGLRDELLLYEDILRQLLVKWVDDGKELKPSGSLERELTTMANRHVLPAEAREGAADIFAQLVRLRLIKPQSVDWRLAAHVGKEEEMKKCIMQHFVLDKKKAKYGQTELVQRMRTIFEKFHADDAKDDEKFQEYLTSLGDELVQSAGQLKVLDGFKVEYEPLVKYYSGTNYVDELDVFNKEDFNQLPRVSKQKPWFDVGAAAIPAILGVAQIGIGVAIGVVSGGTLANLSMILVSEGGSDLLHAIQAGVTGEFSWTAYGVQKAFSVGVSILTGGLAGLSNASLIGRIGMEVLEEVVKKTVWTVGRYAVQGIASTALGLGIEKLVHRCQNWIVQSTRQGFRLFLERDKEFKQETAQLRAAMLAVHQNSYRLNQAEEVLEQSRAEREEQQSPLMYSLRSTISHLVHVVTGKLAKRVAAAWGKCAGVCISSLGKLFEFCVSGLGLAPYLRGINRVVIDHVRHLTAFMQRQADDLKRRQALSGATASAPAPSRSDKRAFARTADTYVANLNSRIQEDVANTLEQEFALPVIKTATNRALSAAFDRVLQKQQANFGGKLTKLNGRYRKQLLERNRHAAVEVAPTRTDSSESGEQTSSRHRPMLPHQLANSKYDAGFLSNAFGDNLHFVEFGRRGTARAGSEMQYAAVLIVDQNTTAEQREQAEAFGVPTVRKIHLP